ncbi:MAG: RnfABCDGE type electron transport complex subunit G [Paludibacter sp.]|nr:RnfABCDGE type electron transport complex subunit G [Paludibacter sp.]
MAQLESSFKNMLLVLTGITLFAAITLSSVYTLTKEPIAASKIAKQQNAIKEVLPPFDHLDANPIEETEGVETTKIFKAYDKANNFVGAAVEATSNNGFSGKIIIMVGFDKKGSIVNYSVLEQKETPGLGTKMVDWFKTEKGNQNIVRKNMQTTNLTVAKDGGEVDAISGATISSRAFLFAVRNAYFAYEKQNQGTSQGEVNEAKSTLMKDSTTLN